MQMQRRTLDPEIRFPADRFASSGKHQCRGGRDGSFSPDEMDWPLKSAGADDVNEGAVRSQASLLPDVMDISWTDSNNRKGIICWTLMNVV